MAESNTKIQNMDCTGCTQPALYCRKCIRKVMEYWEIEDFYKVNNSEDEIEDFVKQLSRETTLSQEKCSIVVRDIFLRDGNITDLKNLYYWFGLGGLMLCVSSDGLKGLLGGKNQ